LPDIAKADHDISPALEMKLVLKLEGRVQALEFFKIFPGGIG
jgi:hypothetical protein